MTLVLLLGAGAGLGLFLVLRGWYAPRPSLADALEQLRSVPRLASIQTESTSLGVVARAGRPLAQVLERIGLGGLVWSRVRRDLAVLERPTEVHLAEKAALGIFGIVLIPCASLVLSLGGVRLPIIAPIWGALLVGGALFFLPDLIVHHDAATRRRDFRHALGAFLDLVVIDLAGGGGVETALDDAVSVGDSWAFSRLRRAIDEARLSREPPWDALGRLGAELGIDELGELAASVALAGTEGAKVRSSLAAKATSIRAHELAEAEAEDQATTEKMSLPVVLLFAGFLLFVGFAAVEHVLAGL